MEVFRLELRARYVGGVLALHRRTGQEMTTVALDRLDPVDALDLMEMGFGGPAIVTVQTWVLILGVGSALLSIGAALVGLPSFRRPPPRGPYTFDDLKGEKVTRAAEDMRA